jgi:tetratricopeptide (TPR) repeat protein
MIGKLLLLFAIFAGQAVALAQETPLQKLMKDGMLMGTDDLKDNCNYTKQNLDRSECNQKSVLIAPLREILARKPRDYEANYFLGYVLVEVGKPAEAISPLEIAAEQHPEYQWSYTVLAEAYDNLGEQAKAISLMEASLKRPKAHFPNDSAEGQAGFRYYDSPYWESQLSKQYRYYVMSGQADKAKNLLAAYPPQYEALITSAMRTITPLDSNIMGVNIFLESAVDYMNKGDKQKAHELFIDALNLEPDDPVILHAVGSTSFDIHKYSDALWAYQSAADMGETLNNGAFIRMGISFLVLGDYQAAYRAFDRAYAAEPLDSNVRRWRIAASFGVGGWDLALKTLIAAPPLDPEPPDFNVQRLMTFDIVYAVFKDADDRARNAGLRYPRLDHLSCLHELLADVEMWSFGNLDHKALAHEKWTIALQTVEIYRSLPLKRVPPKRALEHEILAQRAIQDGKIGYDSFRQAVAATTIAPWWPEAHYNLANCARNSNYTNNLIYDGDWYGSNARIAAQELVFYLNLAPQGKYAADACRQLKELGGRCSTN